jgi:hypothetical protein
MRVRNQLSPAERRGNWVQQFAGDEDALLSATAQFSRYQEVEAFARENFERQDQVEVLIRGQEGEP